MNLVPVGESRRIDVHLSAVDQLFNSMDPAPFHERVLDADAEAFIVGCARQLSRRAALQLVVHLSRPSSRVDAVATLPVAVREHFARRAQAIRDGLRRLFRVGRWSLLIGVLFVAAVNVIWDLAAPLIGNNQTGRVLQESMIIGAWVALWRPLEIFLYDWWPIFGEARLFDRLSTMQVEVVGVPGPDAGER